MPEILSGIASSIPTEEQLAIEALFPTRDAYKRLQMITEYQPRAITPLAVLGVIRRRFGSSVLKMFQEEYNLNQIARERKGRIELSEVLVGIRRPLEKEELV